MKIKCKICRDTGVIENKSEKILRTSFEPCKCQIKEAEVIIKRKMAFNSQYMREKRPK